MTYQVGQIVDYVQRPIERLDVPVPRRWYVLRAHPGMEGKVAKTLRQRDICYSQPQMWSERTVRRTRWGVVVEVRKRRVLVSVFPGFIFVPDFECVPEAFNGIEGLSGYLRFGDWRAYLRPDDMQRLNWIVDIANTPRSKRERKFALGQLIRVVDGPFACFSGRIERLDSKGRLSVLIDVFKRMTPTELEEGQIEPVSDATHQGTVRRRHRPSRRS